MPEKDEDLSGGLDKIPAILVRRRWWIITALCVTAVLAAGISLMLPDRYSSYAVLVVDQQQVSKRFVEPSSYMSAGDSLQIMTKEILSRSRLMKIINAEGLYPVERQHLSEEQLTDVMRKDIQIDALNAIGQTDIRTFSVSFSARTPEVAQIVTNRLASLFIEENLKARSDQAERTSSFVTEQLEATKKKLEEQEQRLQDFKMNNLGQLPDQQQSNLTNLTDLRIELQRISANLNTARQTRASLESTINGKIALLQSERSTLLTRYTPRHTEVIKKDQEIEKMQALMGRLKTGSKAEVGDATAPDSSQIIQLKGQIDSTGAEIDTLTAEEQRLRTSIARFQGRLNLAPVREQQLAAIERDYDSYRKDYSDLLAQQLQSQRTTRLETGQDAQRFRLIDSASFPHRPSGPKRLKISAGGLAAGLFLGLALAFLVDSRDRSFRDEKELRKSFSFPIMLGIPVLSSEAEERSHRKRVYMQWALGCVMFLAVFAAEILVLQHR